MENLCEDNGIEWAEATQDMINNRGLELCPTTLFLQDDVVFMTMYGTRHIDEMESIFKGLRWSINKS